VEVIKAGEKIKRRFPVTQWFKRYNPTYFGAIKKKNAIPKASSGMRAKGGGTRKKGTAEKKVTAKGQVRSTQKT